MSKALELAQYYQRHLPAFAADCLQIRLESGGTALFAFNETQWDLHRRLQSQLSQLGKVRAIILKPRREGLSTYIGARFYHKTIFGDAIKTRITTHLDDSTKALFKMVKLFQASVPIELRPSAGEDSANSLTFPKNLGAYALSTARTAESGRGDLTHCFHGSEVAYWSNAEDVVAASMETVGDVANTEIVLESTGAPNTFFKELWDKAVGGDGEFMPIFYPWYLSKRNRADAEGLILRDDERDLLRIYPQMSVENIAFRRKKLALASESKFRREYPATPADAFIADAKEAFINPDIVALARGRKVQPYADWVRILGCDPSQTAEGDKCGLCVRQGSVITDLAQFRRETVQERADVIRKYFHDKQVDFMFIDQGGSGKEIYELLLEWGLPRQRMMIVPFSASASDKQLYPNKRAEMYHALRTWLSEEGAIPDNEAFAAELSLTRGKINNNGLEVPESKKEMRSSPNLADAAALTFAYPVSKRFINQHMDWSGEY